MSLDSHLDLENRLQTLLEERLQGVSQRVQEWLEESQARAGSLAEIIEEARRQPLLIDPLMAAPDDGAGQEHLADLVAFAHAVETSADQVAILERLVSGAAAHAGRVILFVARDASFVGWAARGFPPDFTARKVAMPLEGDSLLSRARAGCAAAVETPSDSIDNEELAAALGDETPMRMLAAPIWVRDRVAAILYADTFDLADAWRPEMVRLMTSLAALSLEAVPARTKFPRPAAGPPQPRPACAKPAAPATPGGAAASETWAAPDGPDPEELRMHEDARRFARLLVSEIVLYNEKEIEEGRRNKDLYQRLKEDIERSRQMYAHRVSPGMTGAADYFRQELVRTLAEGDESALNAPWG